MSDIIELKTDLGPLRDPCAIAAFAVRRRGGRLASTALSYVADEWHAELVAKLDTERFYDLTVRRPQVRYANDKPVIDWPETNIYLARPDGAERDIFLLVGFEPSFHWRSFVQALEGYLAGVGVRTIVNLRCLTGSVPHTRPAPVIVASSDIELELQFGVQTTGHKYEGPADISSVLGAYLQSQRWKTADLSVLQPEYFPRMPNAQASMSLIKLIDRAFGTETAIASLQETAQAQLRAIDDGFVADEGSRSMIRDLERRYDNSVEQMDFLVPSTDLELTLPTGDEVIEEVERLLGDLRNFQSDEP